VTSPPEAPPPPPLWSVLRREGYACAAAQLRHPLDAYARLQALRLALCPVDFWRFAEFPAVLNAYRGEACVFDLGSPRLLARYLVRAHRARVVTCDLSPSIADEVRIYRRGVPEGLDGLRADGMRLPIATGAFPFAYSVSVLEHIADEGDRAAMGELARILAPGGRLAVTVPCAPRHGEIWLEDDRFGAQARRTDGKVFFSRLYDWDSARERLVRTPGLDLVKARSWRVRDAGAFEQYQQATARPRSVASVWAKLRDPSHARRMLEECTAFEADITPRGVLLLEFEKRSNIALDK